MPIFDLIHPHFPISPTITPTPTPTENRNMNPMNLTEENPPQHLKSSMQKADGMKTRRGFFRTALAGISLSSPLFIEPVGGQTHVTTNEPSGDTPADSADAKTFAACWVLWRSLEQLTELQAYDYPERTVFLHQCFGGPGFESPESLLADLLKRGWSITSFDNTGNVFARIEPTSTGLTVTRYETYASALRAHARSIH
jgi:hypothetical protein